MIEAPYEENGGRSNGSEPSTSSMPDHSQNALPVKEKRRSHALLVIERWYILVLFSMLSFFQSAIWSTYSPITDIVQHVYSWSDANIAILNNWDPITFILTAWIFGILLDKYGLRFGLLLSAAFVFSASALRCIYVPHDDVANTIIQNVVVILDSVAGPILWGIPTVVSAVWFPASQRTVVTSIIVVTSALGSAIPYVIEPAVIHNRFEDNNTNKSEIEHLKEEVRQELYMFYYITCAIVGVLSICAVIHFPSQPRHAPSMTASQPREPFWTGLKDLARSGDFWLLFISYSLVTGVSSSWLSVIYIVLKPLHTHTEQHAGFLGFLSYLVQSILSLAFGKLADVYIKRSKLIIISSLLLGVAIFCVFSLMASGVIPLNALIIDVSVVAATSIAVAVTPNYLEFTNEICYPVSEALCSLTLTVGTEIISIIFYLGISAITTWADSEPAGILIGWLYWTPLASLVLGILPLFFVRPQFKRMQIDALASGVSLFDDQERSPLLVTNAGHLPSTVDSSSANVSDYGTIVNVYSDQQIST